jgi:hypothetical protein
LKSTTTSVSSTRNPTPVTSMPSSAKTSPSIPLEPLIEAIRRIRTSIHDLPRLQRSLKNL